MSRSKWLVLVLAFVLQAFLAFFAVWGVILQPVIVTVVVFANYLSAKQTIVILGLCGILSELLSSGSAGEVLATYLSFGLVISAIKYFRPQYLEMPGMLFVMLFIFSSIFGIVSLLPVTVITPTMLGIVIAEITGLFIISSITAWFLKSLFSEDSYE